MIESTNIENIEFWDENSTILTWNHIIKNVDKYSKNGILYKYWYSKKAFQKEAQKFNWQNIDYYLDSYGKFGTIFQWFFEIDIDKGPINEKSMDNFEECFSGIYESPGAFAKESFQGECHPYLTNFIDWEAVALDYLNADNNEIYYMPNTTSVAIFRRN